MFDEHNAFLAKVVDSVLVFLLALKKENARRSSQGRIIPS